MRFVKTPLAGAFLVELELHSDERGSFARTYCARGDAGPELHSDERGSFARTSCAREYAEHGLNPRIVQTNVSWTRQAGTIRGMHYQAPPAAEAKLVRCTRGAIHDVIVDLRPESPSYLSTFAARLD